MAGQTQEICTRLRVDPKTGLSDSEVMQRLIAEGGNLFSPPARLPIPYRLLLFAQQNLSFLLQLLLLLSVIRPLGSEGNVSKLLHILLCLFLMGPLFYRTYVRKKEEILESVELLDSIRVLRKGIVTFVDTAHLVRGDIVFLGTDNYVPADIKILTAESLYIDMSPLTYTQEVFRAKTDTLLLRGAKVVCGIGNGVVVATGDQTFQGKQRQRVFTEQNSVQMPSVTELALLVLAAGVVCLGLALAYFETDWPDMKHVVVATFVILRFHEDYQTASNVVDGITKRQIEGTGLVIDAYPPVKALRDLTHVCVNLDDFVKKKRKQVSRMYVNGKIVNKKDLHPGDGLELATCCVLGTGATFEVNPAIKERRVIGSPEDGALLFFAETQVDIDQLQSQKKTYQRYETAKCQLSIRTKATAEGGYAHRLSCVGNPDFVLKHTKFEYIAGAKQAIDTAKLESVISQLKQTGYSLVAVGYLDLDASSYSENYQFTDANVPMQDWVLAGLLALNDELMESFGTSLEELRNNGFRVTAFTAGSFRDTLTYFAQLGVVANSDPTEPMLKTDEITVLDGERLTVASLFDTCESVPVAVVCHLRMNDRFDLVTQFTSSVKSLAYMSGALNDIPPMRAASFSISLEGEGEELLKANSNFSLVTPDPKTLIRLKEICVTEPQRRFSTLQHLWGLFLSQLAIFAIALAVRRFDPSQLTALFLEIGALNAPCYTFGPLARKWGLEAGLTSVFAGCYAFFTVLADLGIPLQGMWIDDWTLFEQRNSGMFTTCFYEDSEVCYKDGAFLHAQTAFFISVSASQWCLYSLMQLEDYFRSRQSLHWGTIHITYFFKLVFLLLLAFIPKLNAILRLTPIHFEHFAFPGVMFAAAVYAMHLMAGKAWQIVRE